MCHHSKPLILIIARTKQVYGETLPYVGTKGFTGLLVRGGLFRLQPPDEAVEVPGTLLVEDSNFSPLRMSSDLVTCDSWKDRGSEK